MFGERRAHQRLPINRVARIVADQLGTCECTITDISEGGARLFVSDVELPERFLLQIFADKSIREECKVMWRLGGEMGVQFVTKSLEKERAGAINQLRALSQQRFKSPV